MANRFQTVFTRLNRVLGGETPTTKFRIDPTQFDNASSEEIEAKRLEAQQSIYLQNQWKKIDNELYNKGVYYEPTRIASYYDFEAMEYCIAGDTKIATPDGFITIKELADKGRDHEFIIYAYDHNQKKVVPAFARNAHYTRDEMAYKVTFDDGTFIVGTWEHRLMKRDGSFARISELKEGDSMMPFYRKSFYNNQNYSWVYTCNAEEGHHGWISEHNMIAEWFYETKLQENEEVHHVDFNGKNNRPENLLIMDRSEHRAYHARLNNEILWSNPDYRAKMLEISKRTDNKHRWNGARSGDSNPAYFHIPFDLITETAKGHKTLKKTAAALGVSYRKLQRDISGAGYKDWATFCDAYGIEKSKYSTAKVQGEAYCLNHKVVSVEEHGVIPVYDLTVPGFKNFATDTIFSHNTPEISAALDIFAEEATTAGENGKILTIYSESNRIKHELEKLFYDILDVDTNLTAWARNLCKYGDNFVYHKILPKKGIVGVAQLPNIEITRNEGKFHKTLNSSEDHASGTKFYWQLQDIEFNSFEISHFRLLGDDRKLPYGTSMLEKVRRIWKQLLMSEDAMLVYRITRAPERRVYKVYVGNMDDKDIDPYVDKIANSFKRTNVVNSNNGNTDTRVNPLAVDQDFFIPIRDPNLPMPIETLPGASNLSEIADIEYIQKKMLAALRIPKTFLGFEEAMGDGKNLAILDIRFARAVHRVQKALIQELNKMAIIHLHLTGFQDDLNNFTLSLTSPSTQADMLKIQNWTEKMNLYQMAVADAGNGFAAMSMTKAKKDILGMSDDEIKLDVQRQVVEKAASEELKVLGETIKQTGVFKDIYKVYKINPDNLATAQAPNQQDPSAGGGAPGGGGGGAIGGVGQDFTTGIPGEEGTEPGAEGDMGADQGGAQGDQGDQGIDLGGSDQPANNDNEESLMEQKGDKVFGNNLYEFRDPIKALTIRSKTINENISSVIRDIGKHLE